MNGTSGRRIIQLLCRLAGVVVLAFVVCVPSAIASVTPNLVGAYHVDVVCTSCGGAMFTSTWQITTEDPSTGSFSGTGTSSDGHTESLTGTLIGDTVSITDTYESGYVAYDNGTLASDGSMSGTFTDSLGQSGTWTATPTGFTATPYATGFATTSLSVGPIGLAFDGSGNLYVADQADNHVYKFPPGGGAASSNTQLTGSLDSPTGLAFDKNGNLYVALAGSGEIDRIDTSTGAVRGTFASGLPNAHGIAFDPLSGDMFVTEPDARTGIFRVASNGSVTQYSSFNADGIAVAPNGTIFAAGWAQNAGQIARIDGTNTATPGVATVVATVPNADGVAFFAPAPGQAVTKLVINRNDGTITEVDLSTSPATLTDIITGGSRGDFETIGSDGCLYATQSDSALKVTATNGSCPFLPSGPPPPPPATLQAVALPPSYLHVDDSIDPSQPVGAFLDPSNTTGATDPYQASVDFGAGNGPQAAVVSSASSSGVSCPQSLNDPSGVGCFLIFSDPQLPAPYEQAGSYQMTVSVSDQTANAQGSAAAAVTIPDAQYLIELKAWIPFSVVVDPLNPLFSPASEALVLGWPTCGMPLPLFALPSSIVVSVLTGNDHDGFDGSFKVDTVLQFDWTGSSIVNPQVTGTPSLSHRDIIYQHVKKTWRCGMTALATMTTTSGAGGASFHVDYSSATPLAPGAPTIDGLVNGTFGSDGTIALSFLTDGFPSHGLTIRRDGFLQQVDILNDASCIGQSRVLGPGGLVTIGRGLTGLVTSAGTFTDTPAQLGFSGFTQLSGLC